MIDTTETKISPPYRPVGLGPQSWTVVEPGLFEYPVPEGAKPALLGSCCTKCGRKFFPARVFCPDCFDEGTMEKARLNNKGTIYTSTVVRVPSPIGIKPPYAYGYVDLIADNVRVHALFTGTDLAVFAPGREVELVIEPFTVNKQGQQVIGYRFRPTA